MRRVVLLVAAIALSPAASPVSSHPAGTDRTKRSDLLTDQGFSTTEAFSHVRRLAGRIGPRPAGSKAYRRAVRYVTGELTTLGYEPTLQQFRVGRQRFSWNVVAVPPETGGVRMLVGAHLDTVPGSPGGNDNASGVAVLLEVARLLVGSTSLDSLALVAFGAEEVQPDGRHHLGSTAYVRRMSPPERDGLDLMVSVDMVGKVHPFISGHLRGTSAGAARTVARAARASGTRATVRTLGDISDHGPFALAGMPAALLWTGDEQNHHRPTDVVRNVARRSLPRAVEVILEVIPRVLGAG
jgi:aminopeptidase YwaD